MRLAVGVEVLTATFTAHRAACLAVWLPTAATHGAAFATTKATLRWPSRSRSAGLQGSCKSYALVGLDSGGGIRTRDLRVMRPGERPPPRRSRRRVAILLRENGPHLDPRELRC